MPFPCAAPFICASLLTTLFHPWLGIRCGHLQAGAGRILQPDAHDRVPVLLGRTVECKLGSVLGPQLGKARLLLRWRREEQKLYASPVRANERPAARACTPETASECS